MRGTILSLRTFKGHEEEKDDPWSQDGSDDNGKDDVPLHRDNDVTLVGDLVVVMMIGDPRFGVAISSKSRFYMACIAIAMTMAKLHLDIPQNLGSFG